MHLHKDIQRVLVTGATGFLGFRVVAALLEAGVEVTVVVRPEQEAKLASFAGRVRVLHGDIWNRGSLKGLARGQNAVVHLVGSTRADPARGLTHQQINLVAARNVIGMAVGDGVLNFALLSVAALPGMLPAEYVRSKRDAEEYLQNSGLHWIIIRPSLLYTPSSGTLMFSLLGLIGRIPPFRWLIGRYTPLAVETAARGIAAAVRNIQDYQGRILYAGDLRRLARRYGRRGALLMRPAIVQNKREQNESDEPPFGWLPSTPRRRARGE